MPDEDELVLWPPNGVDRADGSRTDESGNSIGTANPPGTVMVNNQTSAIDDRFIFEELPDSPEIERAEQGTIQHRFKCDPETGLELLKGLGRGRFMTDTADNTTRVVS